MGNCRNNQCRARIRCTGARVVGHGSRRVGHWRRLQPSWPCRIQKSLRSISDDGSAVVDCLGWSLCHHVGQVSDNEGESGISVAGDDSCSTGFDKCPFKSSRLPYRLLW